jgi:hypothetical protein
VLTRPPCRARTLARTAVVVLLLAATPLALHAQGNLRGKLGQLFVFGEGEDPLFLAGSANPNNPASIQAHGSHFIPAAVAENASIIGFLTDAISQNVANVPIGATSGGQTFRFEGGVPVATSTSAGPIFAERAQTLGRGRAVVGVGRSQFHFSTLRGEDLSDLQLFFTHQNVDFEGCDAQVGGDCSLMGLPGLENDVILFNLALDLDVTVTSFYATFGLFDRLDVGVLVPLVSSNLHGQSTAQVIPFGGPTAAHFFAGTPDDPQLAATRFVDGSSFGLGDVATRLKLSVLESQRLSVALLGDARFATGSAEDFLGAGSFSARGLAIMSARYGAFSPHANVGYAYRSAEGQNDAVLATVGFDHLMSNRVTLAADLVSELQVGASTLHLPPPVHFDVPFHRTLTPTTIPDIRDDIVNGSLGAKFLLASGFTAVGNILVPLNRGGLRPDRTFTFGVEYSF